MRAATPQRVRPRWRSRPSWALRVQLTDSMIWRSGRRNRRPGRGGSVWAAGRMSAMAAALRVVCEAGSPVALVGDEGLAPPGDLGLGDHLEAGVALVGFGRGERVGHRQPRRRCDEVQAQAQAPEVPRVRGAVAVGGPSCEVTVHTKVLRDRGLWTTPSLDTLTPHWWTPTPWNYSSRHRQRIRPHLPHPRLTPATTPQNTPGRPLLPTPRHSRPTLTPRGPNKGRQPGVRG